MGRLKKEKVREAIKLIGKIETPDYFGKDQAYVTYPIVFPTVTIPLKATDELNKLVESSEQNCEFYIGLNDYLSIKIDTCIEAIDSADTIYLIDIDDDALSEVCKILDEQLAKYGQSVDGLLNEARRKFLS